MRHLLKESSEFSWNAQHDEAFRKMKELITREPGPVLTYFDPNKELRLQVDASKYGRIKIANRQWDQLCTNRKRAVRHFICMQAVSPVCVDVTSLVESDHKPLESIMQKPLAAAPPRLQRRILQLQRYNFSIMHRPGKDIPVADTLSRKSLSDQDGSLRESMDKCTQYIAAYPSATLSWRKSEQRRKKNHSSVYSERQSMKDGLRKCDHALKV